MTTLSVIIPAYNEEARLVMAVEGFRALCSHLGERPELVLVNDGSSDTTAQLARTLIDTGDLLLDQPHRGKGGAVRAGVLAASGERLLVTDVDWSVPPEQAIRLLDQSADLVLSSREGPHAHRIGEPFWRHLLGRGFNLLVQALLLPGIRDTQCGCKLFRKSVFQEVFKRSTVDGWAWDVEIILLARQLGASITEIPVCWRYEPETRLKVPQDTLSMAIEILRIRRDLAQRPPPSTR